ncbi:hypothetical protein ACTWLI_13735 [Arthrobacter sp. Hor0625]|uniref:hypothetical protein n=1 Tax=Arthrobacter sp. Hor0625 TaxID=3457358 RepID=UPI00403EF060
MGSLPSSLRRSLPRLGTAALLLAVASCSTGTGTGAGAGTGISGANPGADTSGATAGAATTAGGSSSPSGRPAPLSASISQFRDNYGKPLVEIQLTNTGSAAITAIAATLHSPLFPAGARWAPAAGTELPPGQVKSLSVRMPAADCRPAPTGKGARTATVEVRFTSDGGSPEAPVRAAAEDPFGVLVRNHDELCLAQAAAEVAAFGLGPGLDRSPDGRTAVLRLVITPARTGSGGTGNSLVLNGIGGTTLLAEDPALPWPGPVRIAAGGPERVLRLGVRPARCDPHTVAEDKVGTLLPLTISAGGRDGVLKVAAGAALRGQIYDFITSACRRQ